MWEAKQTYDAKDMMRLYNEMPQEWLLLEVLEYDKKGRANKLRLLQHAKDKEQLYDFLMENSEDWNWNKNYIFVYSDPDKQCVL